MNCPVQPNLYLYAATASNTNSIKDSMPVTAALPPAPGAPGTRQSAALRSPVPHFSHLQPPLLPPGVPTCWLFYLSSFVIVLPGALPWGSVPSPTAGSIPAAQPMLSEPTTRLHLCCWSTVLYPEPLGLQIQSFPDDRKRRNAYNVHVQHPVRASAAPTQILAILWR